MRFAIVREGEATFDAVNAVPDQLRRRTLAVRGLTGVKTAVPSGMKSFPNELLPE